MNRLNKKASDISSRKTIFYIIFGFLAVATFLIIIFLIPARSSEISTIAPGLEDYIIIGRLMNSPSCFAFQDELTKRTKENLVDIKKFTQQSLDNCYNEKETSLKAYRITLEYENEKKTIATMNWEGFLSKSKKFYVNVNDEEKIKQGTIVIDIQNAK